jgi:hypothetical protein
MAREEDLTQIGVFVPLDGIVRRARQQLFDGTTTSQNAVLHFGSMQPDPVISRHGIHCGSKKSGPWRQARPMLTALANPVILSDLRSYSLLRVYKKEMYSLFSVHVQKVGLSVTPLNN